MQEKTSGRQRAIKILAVWMSLLFYGALRQECHRRGSLQNFVLDVSLAVSRLYL